MDENIINQQAKTILFLNKRIYELQAEVDALRRKVAKLVDMLNHYLAELQGVVPVDSFDVYYVRGEYAKYRELIEETRLMRDPEVLARVATRVFLPLCYIYIVENVDDIRYDEFLEWLRKRHPVIYRVYRKETITRLIRKLRELGYLTSPRKGVFRLTRTGIETLKQLRKIKPKPFFST